MSVREGFRRIEALYWRRWWLLLVAPAAMFAYRTFEQPAPIGVDPGLWFLAKPALLGILSTMGLALVAWIALGFFAPRSEWEQLFEAARASASKPLDRERTPRD